MSFDINNVTVVQTVTGKEPILGHLMWYSVGKQLIKADDLENALFSAGLNAAFMPNKIRSVDAFRRATKEIETKKATGEANVYKNYLVREVFSDKETVQRNIVVETVDQSGKRLDYDSQAGIITLDKKNDSLTFVTTDSTTEELCRLAEDNFNLYKQYYSSQQVRVMVNKILNSLAPIPVRPNGGVYFVPEAYTEGLTNLVKFASFLENSEGFKVPVVNTYDNVQMVSTKLSDHFDTLLNDCKSSGSLRKSQLKDLINQANGVIGDYKDYRNIVMDESSTFEEKILKLKKEVARLVETIDE